MTKLGYMIAQVEIGFGDLGVVIYHNKWWKRSSLGLHPIIG